MKTKEEQYRMMTEMPVRKLIPRLATPTIISMMTSAVYNAVDTWFVSRLGDSATAAIGICLPVTAMIQAIGFWIGMGAGSNISRFLGRRHIFKANIIATSSLVLGFLFSILLGVFGFLCDEPFMRFLGSTPTILPFAKTYSNVILMGAPFAVMGFVLNNVLRSQGRAIFAMLGIASGAVINIVLDPLLIYTCNMGIAGAALATNICQLTSFSVMFLSLRSSKSMINLHFKYLSKNIGVFLLVISTGLPSLFRQGCSAIATILLNRAGAAYGDAAVAAMSIVGRVNFLITSIVGGFGQGYQPVVGFAYGAKIFQRVRQAYRFSLVICLTIMIIGGLCCIVFAENIVTLFRAESPRVIEIGAETFVFYGLALPFNSVIILTNMLLQVTGQKLMASVTSVMRQGVVFIPLILILPHFIGLKGVEMCQPISDAVSAVVAMSVAIYFFKKLPK
ncbi:MAG: MATE family efflux transporter [Bacteroidales bacterium]|jgi:putative MATE family efflux protein|nr:MATE family efflux transporter [Bacteroidales bacterium]